MAQHQRHPLDHSRIAHQRLQAAALAALAARAIRHYSDMPELARPASGAAIQLAVQHHTQAHATANADHQKIIDATPSPKPLFGGGQRIDIVINHYWDMQTLL